MTQWQGTQWPTDSVQDCEIQLKTELAAVTHQLACKVEDSKDINKVLDSQQLDLTRQGGEIQSSCTALYRSVNVGPADCIWIVAENTGFSVRKCAFTCCCKVLDHPLSNTSKLILMYS